MWIYAASAVGVSYFVSVTTRAAIALDSDLVCPPPGPLTHIDSYD